MDSIDIEYFRALLIQRENELLQHAAQTVIGIRRREDHYIDPVDRAAFEEAQGRLLRISDRERRLITKIKFALERIDDGTFGICDTCGEEIDTRRLKARPVTTKCIECKTREEALERYLRKTA